MANLYEVRAYRWNGGKYELTCPYVIVSKSKDEARDSLAAFLGEGWKASEAFETGLGSSIPLEQRLKIFEKLGYAVVRPQGQAL